MIKPGGVICHLDQLFLILFCNHHNRLHHLHHLYHHHPPVMSTRYNQPEKIEGEGFCHFARERERKRDYTGGIYTVR